MANPVYFDQSYYLQQKASQLNTSKYQGKTSWTSSQVQSLFQSSGMSSYAHYQYYGAFEGLDPNQYFDQDYYMEKKVAVLNSDKVGGKTDWTTSSFLSTLKSIGMTPYDHFSKYGATEGIDPSSSFDVSKYIQDKCDKLNASGGSWTSASLINAFTNAGMDPISHYLAYGKTEGLAVYAVDGDGGGGSDSEIRGGIGPKITGLYNLKDSDGDVVAGFAIKYSSKYDLDESNEINLNNFIVYNYDRDNPNTSINCKVTEVEVHSDTDYVYVYVDSMPYSSFSILYADPWNENNTNGIQDVNGNDAESFAWDPRLYGLYLQGTTVSGDSFSILNGA